MLQHTLGKFGVHISMAPIVLVYDWRRKIDSICDIFSLVCIFHLEAVEKQDATVNNVFGDSKWLWINVSTIYVATL
jgi:hypothetical protein